MASVVWHGVRVASWVMALLVGWSWLGASEAWAQGAEASSAQARTAQYVFVIDDSGSMSLRTRGGPPADPDRLSVFAVRSLLSMLDDADEATVVRLNGPRDGEAVRPIEPLARNRAQLNGELELGGKLAQYAGKETPCKVALDAVKAQLNQAYRPNVAQVVLFLTDGECTQQPPTTDGVLQGLRAHEEGLFKFYLLRFSGRAYTRALEELARKTGGEAAEVGAADPTSILKPFASALSRSQGYEAYLLNPNSTRLDAHQGARRVRLLAVAPDRGQPLQFKINAARQGEAPRVLGAPRGGVHQFEGGRRFRYAALDYKPGATPVTVAVEGGGRDWKVVAVPEYRLFVDMEVKKGRCPEGGAAVQYVEVGASVCARVRLVNELGEVVSQVAGRGTDAIIEYTAPGASAPSRLPANREGDKASFTIERVNLERGDHIFRPRLLLRAPGSGDEAMVLRGAARSLQVSSRSVKAVPARFELGELVPGQEKYLELTLQGNFPPSRGRLVVEGRRDVPECVSFWLSGVKEEEAQKITPNQTYTLGVKVAPYCGHASMNRDINTALRIEFDQAALSRSIPTVVMPLRMALVSKIGLPEALRAKLRGGQDVALDLKLLGNAKKDMTFSAMLPGVKERGQRWPGDALQIAFLDEKGAPIKATSGAYATSRTVTFGPGKDRDRLAMRVISDVCCDAGTFVTEIALIPKGGVKDVVRVPVEITVASAGLWRCWGRTILWGLVVLLVLLLILYIANMFRNSQFIKRDVLAGKLVPLRWDEWGEAQPYNRQAEDVKRLVRKAMPLHLRALNWLKANPLKFGLPGGEYYETVQLYLEPARDVSRSRLVLVPERDIYQTLRRDPQKASGRIYACGRGGLMVFCVPGREGRLGRLEYRDEYAMPASGFGDEDAETFEVVRLRRHELLSLDDEHEADTAAGWRVG